MGYSTCQDSRLALKEIYITTFHSFMIAMVPEELYVENYGLLH